MIKAFNISVAGPLHPYQMQQWYRSGLGFQCTHFEYRPRFLLSWHIFVVFLILSRTLRNCILKLTTAHRLSNSYFLTVIISPSHSTLQKFCSYMM